MMSLDLHIRFYGDEPTVKATIADVMRFRAAGYLSDFGVKLISDKTAVSGIEEIIKDIEECGSQVQIFVANISCSAVYLF